MIAGAIQPVLGAADPMKIIFAGLGFLAVIVFAGLGLLFLRKRLGPGSGPYSGEKFSVETLEEIYQRGMISEAEFKAMRRALMGLGELGETDESKKAAPQPEEPATMSGPENTENPPCGTEENDEQRPEEQ